MGAGYRLRRSEGAKCGRMGGRELGTVGSRWPFAGRVHHQGCCCSRAVDARHRCRRLFPDPDPVVAPVCLATEGPPRVGAVPPPRRPLLAYHGVLAPHAEWRSAIVPTSAGGDGRTEAGARSPRRWPWAPLLRRVFAIQVLVCGRCGGPRRILGAVTEPHAVRRLLGALGLAAEPPPERPVSAA